jgi:CRISPR/Cas system-associated exonuclease Cas4 (RecB family)
MSDQAKPLEPISAAEVANYIVCPEAWRLKYLAQHQRKFNTTNERAQKIRSEWISNQELSSTFKKYARHAYTLLVFFVFGMFLLETVFEIRARRAKLSVNEQLFRVDRTLSVEIVVLLLLLGVLVFTWEHLERRYKALRKKGGLTEKSEVLSVRGSNTLPGTELCSNTLGITGKPHALVREGDAVIPVDLHPFGKKVKDRHIGQLLVHLKIIHEREGIRPPHGLLLLGERSIKIKYTEEKERWLDTLIEEMRSIREGVPAVATPTIYKCRGCDVRELCQFSAAKKRETPPHPTHDGGEQA